MKSEDRLIQIIEQNIDNGRETAFESLIQLHQTFLKKYIAVRVADSRDAEEIFWDSFQKLYNWLILGRRQYGTTVKYMLKRIAKDGISNYWRKKKIIKYVDTLNDGRAAQPEADYQTMRVYLKKLLGQLAEKKRRTLELFNEGYSHEEIAKLVGWANPESSRSQLKKIRTYLEEQLNRSI